MNVTTQIRVRFVETDQQGVVHHSNYLSYFEAARVEFFRGIGYEIQDFDSQQLDLIVVSATINYKRPARFDDLLDVAVGVDHLGTASFGLAYEIKIDDKLISTGSTRLACMKPNGRPGRLPADFRELLASHQPHADS